LAGKAEYENVLGDAIAGRSEFMGDQARRIIELACKLTPDEQEEIVEALLEALGHDVEFSRDQMQELQRRSDAARSDPSTTVDADEAMAELRAELQARQR
jgi:putative addiction module component (TIGR02574 family)